MAEAPGGTPEAAIALRDVTFWYPDAPAGQPALRDLSLTIPAGELALLSGPSGSGKSTLLRLCLGLVPHFSGGALRGSVRVLGHDPTEQPPRQIAAAGVGLVFQNPLESFLAERVGEEVAFGPENLALPPEEMDRRVAESLEAVGMAGTEQRRLRELSAGQQQRVAIAAALALRPRVLLLDEPTAHLDVATARSVLEMIAALHAGGGLTVLISEHRTGLAALLATRALVLRDGALAADGHPSVALPTTGALVSDAPAGRWAGKTLRPAGNAPPALGMRDVGFSYAPGYAPGQAVLEDVVLQVQPGEVVALMGPSGAGKSTLARLAVGLRRPSAGQIDVCGMDTGRTPLHRLIAKAGLVLQNPLQQLLASSVEEEVLLGLGGLPPDEARARLEGVLTRFGLVEVRQRHPLALSEGQRRRVALAATLAREPALLVMDEPTLGQDERGRAALVAVVRELARAGTAVLAITHDLEFADEACDRVLILKDRRLQGDPTV